MIEFLLLFLLLLCGSSFSNKVMVNDKNYNVLKRHDQLQAATILNKIDNDILKLVKVLNSKYLNSSDKLLDQIARRSLDYKSSSLKENYPMVAKKDVSYNLNKGQTIAICLRDYDKIEIFHAYNEVLFVSLHELAHSLNCDESSFMCGNSYGHDTTFWKIFKIILLEAVSIGIYQKKNYRTSPVNYCSMNISYSPLYDNTL